MLHAPISADAEKNLHKFFLPATFQSSAIDDVTTLPEESQLRIAKMLQGRTERLEAEEAMAAEIAGAMGDYEWVEGLVQDEDLDRLLMYQSQQQEWRKLMQEANSSFEQLPDDAKLPVHIRVPEVTRRKKLKRLERERNMKLLRHTLQEHAARREKVTTRDGKEVSSEEAMKIKERKKALQLLRKAYEPMVPPFAADPEELWRRGVTVPPSLQEHHLDENPTSTEAVLSRQLMLQGYNDFCAQKKDEYVQAVRRRYSAGLPAYQFYDFIGKRH